MTDICSQYNANVEFYKNSMPDESDEWHKWKAAIALYEQHPFNQQTMAIKEKAYLDLCSSFGYQWKGHYGQNANTVN